MILGMNDSTGDDRCMPTEDVARSITSEVERHYRENDRPYYLAELGTFLRKQNIKIPAGIQLKEFLKKELAGQVDIVQNQTVPGRIAVTTPNKRERVAEQIAVHYRLATPQGMIDYRQLPFSLVAAFCKVPDEGRRLFFHTAWPFRYETKAEAPNDTYVEIERTFQPSSLQGANVHTLSDKDKSIILQRIIEWARAKSIDLRSLCAGEATLRPDAAISREAPRNALQRLLTVQDPGMESKLRIPLDIAALLARLP
jgi:hypothetical protein